MVTRTCDVCTKRMQTVFEVTMALELGNVRLEVCKPCADSGVRDDVLAVIQRAQRARQS